MNDKLRDAARLLGARNLGKTKTLSDAERERRRVWASGLAKKKAEKRLARVAATGQTITSEVIEPKEQQ